MNDDLPMLQRNPSEVSCSLDGACVGIAGCGGLGSNVAVALVRSGLRRLVIADFDVVEESNLNRQYFFRKHLGMRKVDALVDVLREIRADVDVAVYDGRLDVGNVFDVFADCGVVVEAFDGVESKAMIMRAFADERFGDKFLVAASGVAGYGLSNLIRTEKIGERVYVCGDQCSEVDKEGVTAARVALVAAHQANLVVRILCGVE